MTTVTETPAVPAHDAESATSGPVQAKARKVSSFGRRTCPECAEVFTARHHAAVFCTPAHQRAFHGRSMARGKVAVPFVAAWRSSRNAKVNRVVGKFAFAEICRLADAWNREDAEADRPSMVQYVRGRMYASDYGLAAEDRAVRAGKAPAKPKA